MTEHGCRHCGSTDSRCDWVLSQAELARGEHTPCEADAYNASLLRRAELVSGFVALAFFLGFLVGRTVGL